MGDALAYMLDHFDNLVKFTSVVAAPIDNTACERVLKLVVLSRKNSLFFKNEKGASIGDRLAGLVETCRLNGVAAFDYLLALVRNADQVRAGPSAWLPWTYPRQSAKAKECRAEVVEQAAMTDRQREREAGAVGSLDARGDDDLE